MLEKWRGLKEVLAGSLATQSELKEAEEAMKVNRKTLAQASPAPTA
jgi:hypothetical protein